MQRRLIGFAVVAMAAAVAQPAWAAPAWSADAAPLRDLSVAGLLAPFAAMTAVAAPVDPDYRLSALADTVLKPSSHAQTSRIRRGVGAAMRDYFPFGDKGFHISGGTRFYSRGLVRASRRITPALTFGYTKLIQRGLSLGIEGGAVLGRFDTLAGTLAHAPRLRGAGFGDGAGQLSQIARLTFGYHF